MPEWQEGQKVAIVSRRNRIIGVAVIVQIGKTSITTINTHPNPGARQKWTKSEGCAWGTASTSEKYWTASIVPWAEEWSARLEERRLTNERRALEGGIQDALPNLSTELLEQIAALIAKGASDE